METQGLVVQSSWKTSEPALGFGWPHKLSCESSFLTKAAEGEKRRSVKRKDLFRDYQRVEVDEDNEVWCVNRLRGAHNGKTCSCLGRAQFLLTAPTSIEHGWVNSQGFCRKAVSLHINFLPTALTPDLGLNKCCLGYPGSCYIKHDKERKQVNQNIYCKNLLFAMWPALLFMNSKVCAPNF